ncbi:DUF6438 domain-containing protein [Mucilaginibacter jinjuensis]|uniref:DUF6438 domain-containing protein n=1 Tax=Mucilaginibacter jinjuensis TaxID=1176721 RepID=A0ABY7TDC1_9SPHI|nr:DUF6438 domain-containing protein [Mucilaginibacter jinjuensis]WCT14001.1 DUF6438 domain-containing protein [Mucilaginibacter jinjuensis]
MKYLLPAILCLLFSKVLFANTIDSLKTDKEVEIFINKAYKDSGQKSYQSMTVMPTDSLIKKLDCNGIAKKWNIKNWEKADFNKDGLTDIIVTVRWYHNFDVYAVIDKGNNAFSLFRLSKDPSEDCELAKPAFINKQPVLLFYSVKQDPGKRAYDYINRPQMDTLVFKYGNFIERNLKLANYKVKSIRVKASGCDGTCPVFELRIYETAGASYFADDYSTQKGDFETKIAADKFAEIMGLANYLSAKKLKNKYAVNWTDAPTVEFTFEFTDGSVKEITDYGMQGTFGLSQLYNLVSQLRLSENWKKKRL